MSRGATTPEGITIRPAERADLLAVVRIERNSFPQPWPYDAFEWFLGEPGFLVAVDERAAGESRVDDGRDGHGGDAGGRHRDDESPLVGGVVGYLVADVTPTHGRQLGHVKDVAVHPDHRGRGIGTALLERGLVALARQRADSVKLEVRASNDAAQELYRSFGFETLRRVGGYYDDGEDAIVMIRSVGT